MIEVELTIEMRQIAWSKARDMGRLKNSIMSGEGNEVGFLGELVCQKILGGVLTNTYEYDIILPDGRSADCKSKKCTSIPYPHYECSIANFNTSQKCDFLAFARIEFLNGKYTRGWFLGVIKKEEYFERARKLIKGTTDGSNGFKVRADCYNLRIDELYDSIEEIDKKKNNKDL